MVNYDWVEEALADDMFIRGDEFDSFRSMQDEEDSEIVFAVVIVAEYDDDEQDLPF